MAKILELLGFEKIRQNGSHVYFRHTDGRATVIPFHRGEDLGRGLIRSILQDIDLAVKDYEVLRKRT